MSGHGAASGGGHGGPGESTPVQFIKYIKPVLLGQLVVSSLDIKREFDIPVTEVDIMEEDEDFVWKGQGGLGVRSEFNHLEFYSKT